MKEYVITLDQDDMNKLTFALGLAMGTAMNLKMERLADSLLELSNKVHAGNPTWKRYVTQTEKNPDSPRN